MKKLARYLKSFKKQVIIGPFFKLLEAIFELIVPLVMASIIDKGIANGDKSYVLKMGGVMILLGVLGLVFALICQYSAALASQGVGTKLRNDLFRHINSLSYKEIDELGTNSLITRITNDVNQIQLVVAMLIRLVIRAPFLVIGAAVMALMIDLKLGLIFIVVAPLVSAVLYFVMSRSVPFYKVRQTKLDEVSLITRENLSGARVIRAFSKQEHEKKRFNESSDEVADIAIRVGKLSAFLNPTTFIILNVAIIAIIWFGGFRVDNGSLTQGQIIAFVNYMTQISLALVVVANLVVIFTKGSASAARINEIFETESSVIEGNYASDAVDNNSNITNIGEAHNTTNSVPKIQFKDVSFSYHGNEEYSLEHLTVEIQRGETVGIIGGTGSGKTTLVNLLPRFYDTSKGSILIDGVDVKEYSLEALRKQFGIVPQKAALFGGTILENMRFAKEDATLEEIRKAAKIAQAEEFIESKPEGYNEVVSQGGKNLSGGQKQRLTIARALVGSPEVLILDDSASALDFATDAKLRKAIHENCEGMTVFIVSQRANSIKYADKIIVLDDGIVKGIGTHDELFDRCEVYREICLSQLSEEEVRR
ncbi:ATP-binding cassette, subfamily B [Anaerosporobacter mobilis DSM 15930]|uniref:ATP-binding cassette, subfamily B n=1 Tax=Anaerosporobacter mobilis DSM 15930 TaxID=1120996 RepID=A0A1M7K716_9FIRM|nr:ABC transporter ATP-binding protein [Anaerosporobacter mobilis]SHM61046.1 ATP-binding cassette, subfamily B [Anaerosporobacter mobilis DSM 15930]